MRHISLTPSTRWIAFLDLDGTLFNSRLEISERTRATLRAAERTADIVLASGRPATICMSIAADLLMNPRVVIASNGGTIIECGTNRLLQVASFPSGTPSRIAAIASSAKVGLCVYHPLQWYAVEKDAEILIEIKRSESRPTFVPKLEEYLENAVKLMLVGQPEVVRRLLPTIEALADVTAFITYPEYLEIMPATFNKATGARVARDMLGRTHDVCTMAVGDGVADLPLFRFVDHAVAMSNAPQSIQEEAAYVAPSNDENGAALAVEAFLLGIEESYNALLKVDRSKRSWFK